MHKPLHLQGLFYTQKFYYLVKLFVLLSKTFIMSLLNKVSKTPSICEVYLDFTGQSINLDFNDASFYASMIANGTIEETHFQKGSVSFSEESENSPGGLFFKQNLQITFNSSDENRLERILEYHKTKNVIIKLSDGNSFVLGRNDFSQNRSPKITSSNTHNKTTIQFYTESIIPVSKYQGTVLVGLPEIIPLIL